MPDKIGRFEIVSQIAQSEYSSVYKASDPESGSFVALKAINLQPLGEQAATLTRAVHAEAEIAKALNSHNVATLYGAGEMDGLLCALMEYVQGNSIATMLERKEGFSIWDLQDIARQACQGLDHAHGHKVIHHSLEPAKIMVQWDGVARILGFGISITGDYVAQASGKPPQVLYYMSPEQLRGDPVDARSNLFSIGAILYEMVTERKVFDGEQAEVVRQAIMETHPPAPNQINPRVHAGLSAVIMRTLSKNADERPQSGQELINDLEKCKDNPAKSSTAKKAGLSKPATLKTLQKPGPIMTEAPAQSPEAAPRHFAAAAGHGGAETTGTSTTPAAESISKETIRQSTATVEPPPAEAPRFAVDPMMDESRQAGAKARSFSEIEELPPLKEVYVAPVPAAEEQPEVAATTPSIIQRAEPQKPKVQPREIAKKAVMEIKKTPPKLFLYSIAGAVALILVVIVGLVLHFRESDDDNEAQPVTSTSSTTQPATAAQAAAPQAQPQVIPPPPVDAVPAVSITPKYAKAAKKRAKPEPAAVIVTTGQLQIESVPSGAQIQIDGQNGTALAPFKLTGLTPGQHRVTISKEGYVAETRTLDVSAGSSSVVNVQLALMTAIAVLNSDPSGTAIWLDGKDTGRVTPSQVSIEKAGSHTFLFRKQGYLDETTSANLQIGQTSHLSVKLQALGNTDEIKLGGRFKKLFGGSDTAGMGAVSVKTQPKGAQIAVNNRMVDKMSPVDFYLNPGTYMVDITLSGFKSIHKVVNVDKSGKVVIDEKMDRE